MNSGDTAFVLIATAMVMLMTPGLALFYGGLVRRKNVLATTMQSFICLGLISVLWVAFGYSLAFGPDVGHFIGNLDYAWLKNVGLEPGPYSETIPDLLFCAFQLMFAIITPALITGAFAERMKFPAFLAFTVLWSTVVYLPVCHWVWGKGGWLGAMGALDFAGGTVIHINSGAAALVAALVLGKRKGYGRDSMHPHNLPMTVLGAGLLWFGWFGFNGGSVLSADPAGVSLVFVTTTVAGCAGGLAAAFTSWGVLKKPDLSMTLNGILAGLVGITAGADTTSAWGAVAVGAIAGVIVVFAVLFFDKIKVDDPVGAVSVHGICGNWGTIAVGIFGGGKFMTQLVGTLAVSAFAFFFSLVVFGIVKAVLGLRVSEEEEVEGLDVGEHGMPAYPYFQPVAER